MALGIIHLKTITLPSGEVLTGVKEVWALDDKHWFAIRYLNGVWSILVNCGNERTTHNLVGELSNASKRQYGMDLIGKMIDDGDLLRGGFIGPSDMRFETLFRES